MTELELIIDLHKDSNRQGPVSEKETLKALNFINFPGSRVLKVADIGIGTGAQTLTLAKQINGQIIAVDLFPQFLNQLRQRSEKLGFSDKIQTIKKSMEQLPCKQEELDIFWSEGAIYNIGFKNGVQQWSTCLKTGGYLAVSEMTWITNSRPKQIEDFWNLEYSEIDTASKKIKF